MGIFQNYRWNHVGVSHTTPPLQSEITTLYLVTATVTHWMTNQFYNMFHNHNYVYKRLWPENFTEYSINTLFAHLQAQAQSVANFT